MVDEKKVTFNEVKKAKRYILLSGDVTESSSKTFIEELLKMEFEEPSKDILVIINSFGGSIDAMWAMIDTMNLLRCDVHTLAIGKAMSAGALVLINGTPGKRFATPNSRIMIHQLSGGVYGKVADIDASVVELRRNQEDIDKFILSKTKYTKNKLETDVRTDKFLTPDTARKFGIIDKVVSSFRSLPMKSW